MPRLRLNSITRIQPGVQSRNVVLTGKKFNPASFCACHNYTGGRLCSPLPLEKGEEFFRVSLRVAVLPPDKTGYRRPIYKQTKWRADCFTQIEKLLLLEYKQDWVVQRRLKEKEREEKRAQRQADRIANKPVQKPMGRPKLDLTSEQKKLRIHLQKKRHTYRARAIKAKIEGKVDLMMKLQDEVIRLDAMIETQIQEPGGFQHNPLFDPNKADTDDIPNNV